MGETPTLLLLALEFPPLARVSVHRSLCLAKYLPEFGVRPVVVTADRPSLEAWFGPAREEALLQQLPPDAIVRRVACPRPRARRGGRVARWLEHFFTVDEEIGRHWEASLLAEWDDIVAQHKPAAICVSIPPYSIAPLAVKLARRSGLPLILDFRDNWSQFCAGARPTWLHYRVQLQRERACIEAAAAVVGVTQQVVADLQAAHPQVAREKFHVIANGYDGSLPAPDAWQRRDVKSEFVVGYVGSFYYSPEVRATVMEPRWRRPLRHWLHYAPRREDWLYRSPYFFFRALRELFEQSPALRARVRVRFVGDTPDWLRQQVRAFGLGDVVEHLGRLSHRDSLAFQEQCDALLLTSAKVIGGRDYCIAGKTFEYVAAGRPIAGVVTDGEQRDFLVRSGISVVCDADDAKKAAGELRRLIEGRFEPKPDLDFLRGFHRRQTARGMATLVREFAGTPIAAPLGSAA